jgi:hypothetical protein
MHIFVFQLAVLSSALPFNEEELDFFSNFSLSLTLSLSLCLVWSIVLYLYCRNNWSTGFKQRLEQKAACCGLFTLNDSYKVDPCPTSPPATQACGPVITSHVKNVYNAAGSVGVGLSVTMMSTLISTLVLAIAVNRKHTYARIRDVHNSSDFEGGAGISSLSLNDLSPNTFVIGMPGDMNEKGDDYHLNNSYGHK